MPYKYITISPDLMDYSPNITLHLNSKNIANFDMVVEIKFNSPNGELKEIKAQSLPMRLEPTPVFKFSKEDDFISFLEKLDEKDSPNKAHLVDETKNFFKTLKELYITDIIANAYIHQYEQIHTTIGGQMIKENALNNLRDLSLTIENMAPIVLK